MIGVAVKWIPGRPEIDSMSGLVVVGDERFGGISLADQAALETALQLATGQEEIRVVSLGGTDVIEPLRESLAVGATSAVHIHTETELDSQQVAEHLAKQFAQCRLIICGDYSMDRGSGSVPAFLAHYLNAKQALGLVSIQMDGDSFLCTRRLDGGRREVVRAPQTDTAPFVVSVEGSLSRLRRASLTATLASNSATIESVIAVTGGSVVDGELTRFKPPTRLVAAPNGSSSLQRIKQLTDANGITTHGELVTLTPDAAAKRILLALHEWGYLDSST